MELNDVTKDHALQFAYTSLFYECVENRTVLLKWSAVTVFLLFPNDFESDFYIKNNENVNNSNTLFMKLENRWYAVYTRPGWEKKTAELLRRKHIENYCPINRVVRNWPDRNKTLLEPLFKSYVFINTTETEHSVIKQTDGVLNFVYWLGKPAVIEDSEIQAVRNFLNDYENVQLEYVDISMQDSVKIKKGPLMEQESDILETQNKFVRVYLPSLGFVLVSEVKRSNLDISARVNVFKKTRVSGLYYQEAI